jgi:hypothetical protein
MFGTTRFHSDGLGDAADEGAWHGGTLAGYAPGEHWHTDPATPGQVECLKRRGYDPPYRLTKGEASYVLDKPTPRQRKTLERRGHWYRWLTFAEASELLREIAMLEGWSKRKG